MIRFKKIVSTVLLAVTLVTAEASVLPIVNHSIVVEASTIKMNKTKLSLKVGEKATLKVLGTKKNVKWNSSNKKVATVSSKGQVTAKKQGSTTITAKVDKKTYTCKVTVQNKNELVITVGDSKIYMDEMMFYVLVYESFSSLYDAFSEEEEDSIFGTEDIKQLILDEVVMNEIFYKKALKEGYKLTKNELAELKETVSFLIEFIPEKELKQLGITEKEILKVIEKATIAEEYQTDLINSFNIDEKAVTATVNKEDYRQYKTAYMYFPKTYVNDSGKYVDDKETALKDAKAALEATKKGIVFDNIVLDYDNAISDTLNFVKGDEYVEEAYENAALNLNNDECSDVVETVSGYYIIKMLNNDGLEAYEEAVNEAIAVEVEKQLKEYYEKIKKNYKITINQKVWDKIDLDNMTTDY